jgi:hypothetical protein
MNLKKYRSWFEERGSKLLDKMKQAKLQPLQDPSKINATGISGKNLKDSI